MILGQKRKKRKICLKNVVVSEKCCIFAAANQMVDLAQLVRVPDCGSVGRGFESHIPP